MKKLKGLITGIILCFGLLILAACGGKSSGITAKDVDMKVTTTSKTATIKLTFTENENLKTGAATCYIMAYKYIDGEETSGQRQDVKFTGDVYTSSTVSYSGLTNDIEYHFVLYVTFNKTSKKILTVSANTSSEVSTTISTVDEFKENLVADTKGEFSLSEDLDFAVEGEAQTLSLFTSEAKAFMGTLDGGIYDDNGNLTGCHKISNFKLGSGTYTGLFGYLKGAKIKNLIIENVSADYSSKSTSNIGALAGYSISSDIENVTINDVKFTISASSSAEHNTGGVVGYSKRSSYTDVVANDVTIDYTSAKIKINVGLFAGKLTGDALKNDTTCKNCGVSGKVILASDYTSSSGDEGYIYGGGFVGSLSSSGIIEDCYTECDTTYSTKRQDGRKYDLYFGGFVGANGPESTMMHIKNCLAVIDVEVYGGPISTDSEFDYSTYESGYYLATKYAYLGGFIGKTNGIFRGIFDSYVLWKDNATIYATLDRDILDDDQQVISTEEVYFAGEFVGKFTGDSSDKDTYLPSCDSHILTPTSSSAPDNFTDTLKDVVNKYLNA